ncbi:MAG TPA: flagellar motor protein [Thiobacillaceae bacterium]|nr:flagellar motor protein [Thiobacillaceae bacterium]HNA82286.1 flagellar motor protein [Thiobacillaceae bacterium]HNF89004.1 flagellar motor protein [Thiobacillaceae bacterium]HNH88891.1 flagellar motor protein [Thiobacillaceae bacterium]HNI08752.1 flagellar motor protein [Thiobacillaceae bacterium]
MDIISILGITLSLIAILVGQFLEGGHMGSLLQLTAFMIVIGGTLGAVMLQSHVKVFVDGLSMLKWVFQPPRVASQETLDMILDWSQKARRGGLLALEPFIEQQQDLFQRRGLQMLVDGAEPEVLRETLELDLQGFEQGRLEAVKVWTAAGGYSPTIGILGAVMGLIHVMENLSDPSKLGSGIAVAFVATIYGVGGANLFFLPIAGKLRYWVGRLVSNRELFIQGLVSIANGENPRIIEAKLQGYLS